MNYNVSIREGIEELGIFEKNTDAWVSTRAISRLFGKEHKDILAIIREQIIPNITEEFSRRNFPPSKSKDSRGKTQPEFLLNRKSFAMVVMGFTGKKAMAFKEAYIEAFEAMCTVIDTRQISKAGYKEMTAAYVRRIYDLWQQAGDDLIEAKANLEEAKAVCKGALAQIQGERK